MKLLGWLLPASRPVIVPKIPADQVVQDQVDWWQQHVNSGLQTLKQQRNNPSTYVDTQSGRQVVLSAYKIHGLDEPSLTDIQLGDKGLWLHQQDGAPVVTAFLDEYGVHRSDSRHPEVVQAAKNLFTNLRTQIKQFWDSHADGRAQTVQNQLDWWKKHLDSGLQNIRKGPSLGQTCFETQSGRSGMLTSRPGQVSDAILYDLHEGDKSVWFHQQDDVPVVTAFHEEYATDQTDTRHPKVIEGAKTLFTTLREQLKEIQEKATDPGEADKHH